jgi:hypothetical protein
VITEYEKLSDILNNTTDDQKRHIIVFLIGFFKGHEDLEYALDKAVESAYGHTSSSSESVLFS